MYQKGDGVEVNKAEAAKWIQMAADGLASAILSAAALLELEAVLIDGWFLTGDIGAMDERGRLSLRGRERDDLAVPADRALDELGVAFGGDAASTVVVSCFSSRIVVVLICDTLRCHISRVKPA